MKSLLTSNSFELAATSAGRECLRNKTHRIITIKLLHYEYFYRVIAFALAVYINGTVWYRVSDMRIASSFLIGLAQRFIVFHEYAFSV